jgi:hypothetical protein
MQKKDVNIPEHHKLKKINFKRKGENNEHEYWTYAVFDEFGTQVSTIEYWEIMPSFQSIIGYRKYNMSGKIIEENLNLKCKNQYIHSKT